MTDKLEKIERELDDQNFAPQASIDHRRARGQGDGALNGDAR